MSQAQRTEGAPDQRLASGSSAAGPLRSLSAVNNPADLKYTASHEWLRREADGSAVVGITFHAQDALGELVYVELPEVGRQLKQGEACVVVESTKAASDVYAPVDGEITAANEALSADPALVNSAPTGDGWLWKMKLSDESQLSGLMDEAAYKALIG